LSTPSYNWPFRSPQVPNGESPEAVQSPSPNRAIGTRTWWNRDSIGSSNRFLVASIGNLWDQVDGPVGEQQQQCVEEQQVPQDMVVSPQGKRVGMYLHPAGGVGGGAPRKNRGFWLFSLLFFQFYSPKDSLFSGSLGGPYRMRHSPHWRRIGELRCPLGIPEGIPVDELLMPRLAYWVVCGLWAGTMGLSNERIPTAGCLAHLVLPFGLPTVRPQAHFETTKGIGLG
jgi:hypothetical protein